jgi:hypothetical protein
MSKIVAFTDRSGEAFFDDRVHFSLYTDRFTGEDRHS